MSQEHERGNSRVLTRDPRKGALFYHRDWYISLTEISDTLFFSLDIE